MSSKLSIEGGGAQHVLMNGNMAANDRYMMGNAGQGATQTIVNVHWVAIHELASQGIIT